VYRQNRRRVYDIVFNQDSSRLAIIWRAMVHETHISFYQTMPPEELFIISGLSAEQAAKRKTDYKAIKDKCTQFLKVEYKEYPLSQKEDMIDGYKAEIQNRDDIQYYEIELDKEDCAKC